MTSSDITKFAMLPKLDVGGVDLAEADDFFNPITGYVDELNELIDSAESIQKAYTYIIKYGITDSAKEAFGKSCEALDIDLDGSTDVALENLSSMMYNIWVAIRNALERLWNYLHTNDYISRWTNKNEWYKRKIAQLIATKDRQFDLACKRSFSLYMLSGFEWYVFDKRLSATVSLVRKLKQMFNTTINFGQLNISEMFGDELMKLGFSFNNGKMIAPGKLDFKYLPASSMYWDPYKVHQFKDKIYVDLLGPHLAVDRFRYMLKIELRKAMQNVDNVLRKHDNDLANEKVNEARKSLAGVNCMKIITETVINSTAQLASQWIRMTESYVIEK